MITMFLLTSVLFTMVLVTSVLLRSVLATDVRWGENGSLETSCLLLLVYLIIDVIVSIYYGLGHYGYYGLGYRCSGY